MALRIRHQVPDRSTQQLGVADDVTRTHATDVDRQVGSTGEELRFVEQHVVDVHRGGGDRLLGSLVVHRQVEEVVDDRCQPIGLGHEHRLDPVPGRIADRRRLDRGPQVRHRTLQLVRGIGGEPSLRGLLCLEAFEHAVHRLGQPLDLVAGLGHRHTIVEGLGPDPLSRGADLRHGSERSTGRPPGDQAEHEHQQWHADGEQVAHLAHGLADGLGLEAHADQRSVGGARHGPPDLGQLAFGLAAAFLWLVDEDLGPASSTDGEIPGDPDDLVVPADSEGCVGRPDPHHRLAVAAVDQRRGVGAGVDELGPVPSLCLHRGIEVVLQIVLEDRGQTDGGDEQRERSDHDGGRGRAGTDAAGDAFNHHGGRGDSRRPGRSRWPCDRTGGRPSCAESARTPRRCSGRRRRRSPRRGP